MIRAHRPALKLPATLTLTVTAEFDGVAYQAIYHAANGGVQIRSEGKLVGRCSWEGSLVGSAGDLPEGAYPVLERALADAIYA
jgi:hypothetical protein